MTRNTLIVIGTIIAVIAVYFVYDWAVVTDAERIEQAMYDGARAVEQRNVEAILAMISPNCPVRQVMGEAAFRDEVTRRLEQAGPAECQTTSVEDPEFGPDGTTATVVITTRVKLTGPLVRDMGDVDYPGRVKLWLEKVDDTWKILKFEVYDYLGNVEGSPRYTFGEVR